jgi:hypothetical protein
VKPTTTATKVATKVLNDKKEVDKKEAEKKITPSTLPAKPVVEEKKKVE